jgi:POT family proton-dependent oligopeptide transporter
MQNVKNKKAVPAEVSVKSDGFAGHPPGLKTLFFTELWERFSYYGMRAILMLYMVAPAVDGGLGFDVKRAGIIYGFYTMLVYMGSIPGGFIADRYLGSRRAVFIGGAIIALGHFSLAFPQLPFFYVGLGLIIVGTGLLKPNISAMVGGLYGPDDPRRESGFSIFYMGINIGGFIAPLVCGYLAQGLEFKKVLQSWGLAGHTSWHWGFAAAGVGMLLGLAQYIAFRRHLASVGAKPERVGLQPDKVEPLTASEWRRVAAIGVFFVFTVVFWSIYEQAGTSLNLFADRLTADQLCGWHFPSSWYQSLDAIYVIALAPVFSWLWMKLGSKQPSSPAKFAAGLLFVGLGIGLMVPASLLAASGKVSPLWLVCAYLLQVIGEMCLSPVGLATVTRLAPPRLLGLMMGVWFLAASFGNFLAGCFGGLFNDKDASVLVTLFGSMAGLGIAAAVVLAFLTPAVRKLMGAVR